MFKKDIPYKHELHVTARASNPNVQRFPDVSPRSITFKHQSMTESLGLGFSVKRDQSNIYNVIGLTSVISDLALINWPDKPEFKKPKDDATQEERDAIAQENAQAVEEYRRGCQKVLRTATQNVTREEAGMYVSRAQVTLREELTNDPLLKGVFYNQGSDMDETIESERSSKTSTTVSIRSRTKRMFPLSFIVYTISHFIARSQKAREFINSKAGANTKVPRVFLECLKSSRISWCQNFKVHPRMSPLDPFILEVLGLEKSYLDLEFMETSAGINALFSFFASLNSYADNIVKMVEFNDPIEFTDGNTTTAMSITVCEDLTAKILPGNAYGTAIDDVHLCDSIVLDQRLINSKDEELKVSSFSFDFEADFCYSDLFKYIVLRVCGDVANESPPSSEDANSQRGNQKYRRRKPKPTPVIPNPNKKDAKKPTDAQDATKKLGDAIERLIDVLIQVFVNKNVVSLAA